MALTYTPAPLAGTPLPDFNLPDVEGAEHSRATLTRDARATLVMFICNHCPYVKAIEDRLIQLAREFKPRGLAVVAICANDPAEYPEDAPAELARRAREKSYPFSYLVDESQAVAKSFGAVCTPDFFLYDGAGRLTYRGRLDDSWRNPDLVTRRELAEAITAALDGRPLSTEPNSSMGCSIKWKA